MPVSLIRIIFWCLLVVIVIVFWISLRTEEDALYYTVLAVISWGLTYGAHRWLKYARNKEEH